MYSPLRESLLGAKTESGLRVRGGGVGLFIGYVRQFQHLALLLLSRLRGFFFFLWCVTLMLLLSKDKIILFKGLGFLCWLKFINWAYFVLDLLLVIFVVVLNFWACIFCSRFLIYWLFLRSLRGEMLELQVFYKLLM